MPATPASVLAFLKTIQGKHCVSGQFTEIKGLPQLLPGDAIGQIQALTGKWPGCLGGDYWYFGSVQATADTSFNALANVQIAAGGLVTLTLSMPNPTTMKYSGDVSMLDVLGLSSSTAFLTMLDSIAAGLAGIQGPVILRPYHEGANGNWFWWSAGCLTAPVQIALWQFTHDYLTNVKGLKNLLWCWALNSGVQPADLQRYPGDAYVDLVGVDGYTSNPAGLQADVALLATLGKPVMLAEFGSGSPNANDPAFAETTLIAALKNQLSNVVCYQQWWQPWGMESTQNLAAALTDPWVMNRGDFSVDAVVTPMTPPPAMVIATLMKQLEQAGALLNAIKAGLSILTP